MQYELGRREHIERHTMWLLPLLIVCTTAILSVPTGFYLAWIADGRYRPPKLLRWIEQLLDTGPQGWKQYSVSILLFNTAMFIFGYVVLAMQPLLPLNPDGKTMLAPTTIFHTACSFSRTLTCNIMRANSTCLTLAR